MPGDPEGLQSGNNFWTSVYNSKHRVTTLLGKRSRGFVWFFSFLSWFSQQKTKNEPLILLLDEPGLFLHANAQGDLLRYLEEELNPNHQVLYTTHSPFMIDPKRLDRVRIVEDKSMETEESLPPEKEGTKVFVEVLEASEGSLFPLQGALGYDICQTLFVGPNCLIVEGVSDLLYIQTISGLLLKNGREGLNKNWTITPVGGSGKIPTFASLLGSQKKIKVATLIDIQKSEKQQIELLYKRKLLKRNHVFTFGDFTNSSEADIEDMFEPDFYLKLVNEEFKHSLNKTINQKDLSSKNPRVLIKLETHLRSDPLKNGVTFSHYRPARYFADNISSLESSLPITTLDKFEKAFQSLNKLL